SKSPLFDMDNNDIFMTRRCVLTQYYLSQQIQGGTLKIQPHEAGLFNETVPYGGINDSLLLNIKLQQYCCISLKAGEYDEDWDGLIDSLLEKCTLDGIGTCPDITNANMNGDKNIKLNKEQNYQFSQLLNDLLYTINRTEIIQFRKQHKFVGNKKVTRHMIKVRFIQMGSDLLTTPTGTTCKDVDFIQSAAQVGAVVVRAGRTSLTVSDHLARIKQQYPSVMPDTLSCVFIQNNGTYVNDVGLEEDLVISELNSNQFGLGLYYNGFAGTDSNEKNTAENCYFGYEQKQCFDGNAVSQSDLNRNIFNYIRENTIDQTFASYELSSDASKTSEWDISQFFVGEYNKQAMNSTVKPDDDDSYNKIGIISLKSAIIDPLAETATQLTIQQGVYVESGIKIIEGILLLIPSDSLTNEQVTIQPQKSATKIGLFEDGVSSAVLSVEGSGRIEVERITFEHFEQQTLKPVLIIKDQASIQGSNLRFMPFGKSNQADKTSELVHTSSYILFLQGSGLFENIELYNCIFKGLIRNEGLGAAIESNGMYLIINGGEYSNVGQEVIPEQTNDQNAKDQPQPEQDDSQQDTQDDGHGIVSPLVPTCGWSSAYIRNSNSQLSIQGSALFTLLGKGAFSIVNTDMQVEDTVIFSLNRYGNEAQSGTLLRKNILCGRNSVITGEFKSFEEENQQQVNSLWILPTDEDLSDVETPSPACQLQGGIQQAEAPLFVPYVDKVEGKVSNDGYGSDITFV
ncbi:MAG: hypothetical protein EZS28_023947, partial [Streblomastix strix]